MPAHQTSSTMRATPPPAPQPSPMPPTDLPTFLRRGLGTAVFCSFIALALTLSGQGAWDVQWAYSLAIGLTAWLVIEMGCTKGWPPGPRGVLLVLAGSVTGFVLGTALGDAYSGTPHPLWQGRSWQAMLLLTLATGTILSYFFYTQAQAQQLQLHMAQAQRTAAEAQLKLLEAQLEPHMLFNTLANLRALIATDPERAGHMLDRLIDYLRATLGASRRERHPLADEFARLDDYLALMAVRMGARLGYALDLPAPLAQASVPPLLLQPLVENAIRHGLEPQLAGGRITVRAQATDQGRRLQLCVHDTGPGPNQGLDPGVDPGAGLDATATPGSGFGLQQVRERLATLYGPEGTLELIAASAGGTSAIVTFPLQYATDTHTATRPDR